MNKINDISAELKSMESFLADMSREMPYSAPDGYFEKFGSGLQETMNALSEADPAGNWGKVLPYAVPAGYFEGLAKDILNATVNQEASADLPKEIPLRVPAGYFESLPKKMLLAAKQSEPAKKETRKITLEGFNTFRPVRWAAAAVILICICAGSYITFFQHARTANPESMLASVSANEIHDYLQGNYRLDIDRIVANKDLNNIELENKDIIQYLNETGWDNVE